MSESELPPKRVRAVQQPLATRYYKDPDVIEIGVDEVGRGPMFGRVYTASVILPKDGDFDHSLMKDSKKFHSEKKIQEAAEYIKTHAIAWHVAYEDEKTIDTINILQATQKSMHTCISEIIHKIRGDGFTTDKIKLLIDGNYFKPFVYYNESTETAEWIDHICVEGGDNKYSSIAAASILAKVSRDAYIREMCDSHPELIEHYHIDSNKGYGSKTHLDGIKSHGISPWHRKTFGICKNYA